ncbi:MAG: hypothetical protein NC388_10670 [Clostridium sp.]|nr:hypothetical protein [Clostridium sp.]
MNEKNIGNYDKGNKEHASHSIYGWIAAGLLGAGSLYLFATQYIKQDLLQIIEQRATQQTQTENDANKAQQPEEANLSTLEINHPLQTKQYEGNRNMNICI